MIGPILVCALAATLVWGAVWGDKGPRDVWHYAMWGELFVLWVGGSAYLVASTPDGARVAGWIIANREWMSAVAGIIAYMAAYSFIMPRAEKLYESLRKREKL